MLLHERFIHSARSHPRKVFIVDRTLATRLTYRASLVAALVLARRLRAYDPGLLGIMLPNSAGSVLTILATLMSGRVPVMINYATGAARNAEFAKRRCGLRTIITSEAFLKKIGCPFVDGMVTLEDLRERISIWDNLIAAIQALSPMAALRRAVHAGSEDDTALVLFTSGSESDPKPVVLTHRSILFDVDAVSDAFDITKADVMMANLPFFHVLGQTANLWIPVCRGITMAVHASPLDYAAICRTAREERVTVMAGTPAFWWGYLRASQPGDFASLRIRVVGADKCPDALRAGFQEKHGLPLYEGYGSTETSPVVSVNVPGANRPGSVGKPLPGVDVRIEQAETGEACACGDVGKVLVRGPLVMQGYLNDREATARCIRDGWYDTGDLGRLDQDGYLWLAGRLKRFVKVGGEMVSLVRVEEVLQRLLPDGASCCVVGVPDSARGARIVAVMTGELDERELTRRMAAELPAVALPKAFLRVPQLPTLGGTKTDFRAVEKIAAEATGAGEF
jgi:acyl-[acyl-carrier-protein]-phospholipid O-acyltransferase/long-chain-fatty-acid--[acyl-carrier-protein] ligase